MRCRPLAVVLLFLAVSAAGAGADSVDATQVIGMGLNAVVTTLGLPQNMFTYRGTDASLDDVVFYYPDHVYLFWFKDRVWQVRYDRRATAVVHGVSLGMSRSEVEAAVSERPLVSDGDSLYFDLDTESFPVRVRLVFTGSAVSDIYVYRSDF
jgi:hypothetical protein